MRIVRTRWVAAFTSLVLLALLFIGEQAQGSLAYTFTVKVTARGHESGLEGVSVLVWRDGGAMIPDIQQTDENGELTYTMARPEFINVWVTKTDFGSVAYSQIAGSDDPQRLAVRLAPDAASPPADFAARLADLQALEFLAVYRIRDPENEPLEKVAESVGLETRLQQYAEMGTRDLETSWVGQRAQVLVQQLGETREKFERKFVFDRPLLDGRLTLIILNEGRYKWGPELEDTAEVAGKAADELTKLLDRYELLGTTSDRRRDLGDIPLLPNRYEMKRIEFDGTEGRIFLSRRGEREQSFVFRFQGEEPLTIRPFQIR